MKAYLKSIGAACLGCIALWHATDGGRAITAEGARRVAVADHPKPVPAFVIELMNGDVTPITGQGPVLVEFIYTSCPTICQTSGGDFAQLRDHLRAHGIQIPMYSISFDPEIDDLAALNNYADLHNATGDPWMIARPMVQDLDHLLDVFDVTVIPDNWGGYEHNIAVLLINENGAFSGAFDTQAFDRITQAVRRAL